MSAILESARTPALLRAPRPATPLATAGSLSVALARDAAEIEQALRLRHRVFIGELGARSDGSDGIERDIFDPYCSHLIVRDTARDAVVGTYRVLMPEQAKVLGCLYTDREFWLTRLHDLRGSIVELGRACVDPAYRSGAAMLLLWSGLGALLAGSGHRYLLGCVSVSMTDGGGFAANLYRRLEGRYLVDDSLRVWPRDRLPIESFDACGEATVPPLMKGYLRAGAQLLGEPHRDREFCCVDFPLMLRLDDLNARHQRRFLQ